MLSKKNTSSGQQPRIIQTMKQVTLATTKAEDLHAFIKYVENVFPGQMAVQGWEKCILPEAHRHLTRDIQFAIDVHALKPRSSSSHWRFWTIEEFKRNLARVYSGFDKIDSADAFETIRKLASGSDLHFSTFPITQAGDLPSLRDQLNLLTKLFDNLKMGEDFYLVNEIVQAYENAAKTGPPHMQAFAKYLKGYFAPSQVGRTKEGLEKAFLSAVHDSQKAREKLTTLFAYDFSAADAAERNYKRRESKRPREEAKPSAYSRNQAARHASSAAPDKKVSKFTGTCNHCGHNNHVTPDCRFFANNTPGINPNAKIQWIHSTEGRAAKGEPFRRPDRPTTEKKSSTTDSSKSTDTKKSYKRYEPNLQIADVCSTLTPTLRTADGYATIIVNNNHLLTPVLFDTGALGHANYGSQDLQARLEEAGATRVNAPCVATMCSVFGECQQCLAEYVVVIRIDIDGNIKEFETSIQIFKLSSFDLILSRATLHKHINNNITKGLPVNSTTTSTTATILHTDPLYDGGQHHLVDSLRAPMAIPTCCSCSQLTVPPTPTPLDSDPIIASIHAEPGYTQEPKDVYLTSGDGGNDLDEFDYPSAFNENLLTQNADTSKDWESITFEGEAAFKTKLQMLARSNSKLFSKTLRESSASVTAFRVNLKDDNNWESPKHRTPSRAYSQAQREEMDRQIQIMLTARVISPSTAGAWSHAVLAKKKNGKWRFCVDYRMLNALCKDIGWPLPNIIETLKRIGKNKPKFFAVLDLTSGYHQMALSKSDRRLTAFMTDKGLFEFNRVPFGLKGAPSYFQHTMSQEVLTGLLGSICEVYLDDIIVFAEDEDELLKRLEIVFKRLMLKGITANPDKCHFGLTQIEYVGHLINYLGMHFSEEKLNKVLHFDRPHTQAGMKSFLGLINYFRDHVEHFAGITKPLNDQLLNYTKRKVLQWTPDLDLAFEQAKQAVYTCKFVYYVDDHLELYLHTDASDYAIGGYLFQLIPSGELDSKGRPIYKERPITFCSHILTAAQCKAWPTIEKEAYAISLFFPNFFRSKYVDENKSTCKFVYIGEGYPS